MEFRLLKGLYAASLLLSFTPAARARTKNTPAPPQIIKIIADTGFLDPRYGSSVLVDLGESRLQDLHRLSLKSRDGHELIGRRGQQYIEATVYVPRDLSRRQTRIFVDEVEVRLHRRFGERVRVLLKRSYMSAAKRSPQTHYRPEARDLMLASVVGAGKSMLGVGYWLQTTGWNAFGLSQITLSVLQDQFFHRFGARFNEWKASHEFPFFRKNWLVHFYNSKPFLKTMTVNQTVALLSNGTFRLLSHLAHPDSITSPFSLEFLASFGVLGLFGTPIGAAGDMAPNILLKKGYISERARHYIVNLYALEYQINSLLFQGDMTRYLFLYGVPIEWGGKLIAWAIAKTAPPKLNRLFIFHPALRDEDRDQIAYARALRSISLTRDEIARSRTRDIAAKYELQYLPCEDLLSRSAK